MIGWFGTKGLGLGAMIPLTLFVFGPVSDRARMRSVARSEIGHNSGEVMLLIQALRVS